ncbi:MAG: YncE family protein [Rhodocyclaceae bacterium]|nr:YncE family protein [Rhodocyclaceae bacterium]
MRRRLPTLLLTTCTLLAPATGGAAPFAYITNQGSHDVSVVDGDRLTELRRIPVGRSPAGVVVSRVAGKAFVSSPDGPSVSAIDLADGSVAERRLPSAVVGIEASPDGRLLYLADWYRNRLLVLDATSLETRREVAVGHAPAGIVASPDGKMVFVANRDDNDISVIDTATWRESRRVAVGEHPFALALTPDGHTLLAANVLSDDVSRVELATLRESARIPVGSAPYGIAFDATGERAFVTNQHAASVSVIALASGTVSATWEAAEYPEGIAWSPGRVWVVSWMEERLQVLDDRSGKPVGSVDLGSNPRGFGPFLTHTAPSETPR